MKLNTKIFLLCVLFLGVAHAEQWSMVRVRPGISYTEVQLDSVRKLSTGNNFTVIWRTGREQNQPMTFYSGVINCDLESIAVEKKVYVDGKSPPATTDYTTGFYTSGSYKVEIGSIEKHYANIFPPPSTDQGLLITNVCRGMNGLEAPSEDSLRALKTKIGCSSGVKHYICRDDDIVGQELSRSLLARAGQIEVTCDVDKNKFWTMIDLWLKDATEKCTSNAPLCGKQGMEISVSALGDDLARAAAGNNKCSFTNASIKAATLQIEKTESVELFNKCLNEEIVRVDDGVSSAEVISQAVYGNCKIKLHADLIGSAVFRDAVMPRITSMVLDGRAAKRKLTKPQERKLKSKSATSA